MVMCRWRQIRMWVLETARMSHEIRNQAIVNENESKATRAALAFGALSDHSNVLELMNRYETRFDRQYSRCLQRLRELRSRRNILESEIFEDDSTAPAPATAKRTETRKKQFLQNEPGNPLETINVTPAEPDKPPATGLIPGLIPGLIAQEPNEEPNQ